MSSYLDNIVLLVVFVVGLPYIGGPLLLLSIFKLKSPARIVFFDPQGLRLPRDVKTYLQPACKQLRALGFEPVAWFCLPDLVANAKSISVLLQNQHTAEGAMVNCIYASSPGTRTVMKSKHVEFLSRFRDGITLQTNNSRELGAFRDEPGCLTVQFWDTDRVDELYRRHQAIQVHLSTAPRFLRLAEEFHGDVEQFLQKVVIQEAADYQVNLGRLRRVADGYRPTLKGAFIMAWQELWPAKPIRKIARRRAANRWLREIGPAAL